VVKYVGKGRGHITEVKTLLRRNVVGKAGKAGKAGKETLTQEAPSCISVIVPRRFHLLAFLVD
jgi:hypothetical protein